MILLDNCSILCYNYNTNITNSHLQTNSIFLISSSEKIKLKFFLPYKYTIAVLKICEENNYKMPRGGKITAQDIRNTLNGREHLLIEDAIYTVVKENREKAKKIQERRDEILKA